jgi:hypothetical protein
MLNNLKAWIRYDGTGRMVPGSLILQRNKPKNGVWQEVDTDICCPPFSTTTTSTTNPLPR